MTSPPALDIVIVSFNAREVLRTCLASLRASEADEQRWRITVVDNASRDGSAEVAEAVSGVDVVRLATNVGFAAANNIGIRRGIAPFVLVLNSDTVVGRGHLSAMLAAMRDAPDVAALGPRLVDAEGRLEVSFGGMMSPWNEAKQKVLGVLYARRVALASRLVVRRAASPRVVDWVSGACMLVRRVDAEAVGLFDERYFMYAEDVDFCAALRARGRKVLFWPGAEIVHLRGASRAAAAEETERAYRRSHLAFYAKHHPGWYWVLVGYQRLKR
ncbi:MAG: glycosyltransferase family 2 protein [Vicinamibacterales bacterium]